MLGIGPQTVEKVKIRCRRRTCAEDGADFCGRMQASAPAFLSHHLKPFGLQLCPDLLNLGGVTGFEAELQEAACDRHVGIAEVILHADDVRTAARDDLADRVSWPGLSSSAIIRLHLRPLITRPRLMTRERMFTSMLPPRSGRPSFSPRSAACEEGGRNRRCAGALGHELLVFHQREDRGPRSRPR